MIAFLVHLTLTEAAFGLMTCTDIEPDVDLAEVDGLGPGGSGIQVSPSMPADCPAETAGRRLVLDMDVCCYNPEALRLMYGLGVPAVILFAVGIPAAAGLRLWWVSDHLGSPDVVATLGFLMTGFRVDMYFWEVVIMLRKLAVVAITVVAEPQGVQIQTYSALAVIFAASVLHAMYKPYEITEHNRLEMVALVGAFLTFEAGLFLNDPNSGAVLLTAATAVVFVANMGVLLMGLWVVRSSIYTGVKSCCYVARDSW